MCDVMFLFSKLFRGWRVVLLVAGLLSSVLSTLCGLRVFRLGLGTGCEDRVSPSVFSPFVASEVTVLSAGSVPAGPRDTAKCPGLHTTV